jgi:hypothetical protein
MLTVGPLAPIELRFPRVRFMAACQLQNARHMLMPTGPARSSRQSWYSGNAKAGRFSTETTGHMFATGLSIPCDSSFLWHRYDMSSWILVAGRS